MRLRLDPFSPNGVSVDNSTITVAGGSTTTGGSSVTVAGEDYLSLTAQEITANPIDLDNLSATGTPSSSTFLRGDNTWATPTGSGDVSKVGTPVNNQVGVWTGDGTIEGDADLTFDTTTNTLATANIAVSGTVDGRDVATDGTKLDGIEALADVTDATNVDAAGATMNTDTSLVGNGYFLDEDNMVSNDATKVPSQQSVKAYVDAVDTGVATVVAGNNIDVDATDPANPIVSVETLTLADISDVTASATEVNYTDGVTSAIQTQLDAKAADADVVHDTGNETIAGVKTFSSDPIIPDEAYDATAWNGSLEPPTKNAIRDKIETMGGGGDVVGPASATDNAIARYDSTTGKLIQNSLLTVSDSVVIDGPRVDIAVAGAGGEYINLPTTAKIGNAYVYRDGGTDVPIVDGGTGASTAANARSNLGLGALATLNTVNNGDWIGDDLVVSNGGTGRSTGTTAYSLIATGTTATGAQQTLANGATTEILVGGGASALPVWTTATGSGAPVRATNPTLTTPALGTPSALVLTNATGLVNAGLGTGAGELGAAWSSWTPTLSGRLNDSKWNKACRYKQVGKMVFCKFSITANTTAPADGGSGDFFFTLPVASVALSATGNIQEMGGIQLFDATGSVYNAYAALASTTLGIIRGRAVSGANVIQLILSSTAPFTWTTSDEIAGSFFYETA